MMRSGKRKALGATSVLAVLLSWASASAEEARLTHAQKADALLQLHTPKQSGSVIYPENEFYHSVWLRQHVGNILLSRPHYGSAREQILRVKKLLCVDTEGTQGLPLYLAVAKWQAENELKEDAQQTLREAVAFSRRLKQNPPPPVQYHYGCGSFDMMSQESRIAHAMLQVGSSDEDILNAAAQISPQWQTLQYTEAPYHQLAAQLGRYDLALELTRRIPDPMQAAIHCERVAEEIMRAGDHAMAKLAFEQTLAMIPQPKKEDWIRGDATFPLRAAVCLGHMGEPDLAGKFVSRAKEFPESRLTSQCLRERATEYLDQAAVGKTKLPEIAQDDPEYRRKVEAVIYQCQTLRNYDLREFRLDLLETIPADDPTRFQGLFKLLREWAGSNQDIPKPPTPWVQQLLRQHMELLPTEETGDRETDRDWRFASQQMAAYLIRCGMIDSYRDRFDPQTIARETEGLDRYKRLDYPALSVDEAVRHFQSLPRQYHTLTQKLTWWLRNAQNQADAQQIAALLVESDQPIHDPAVAYLAGDQLLGRQLLSLQIDSTDVMVECLLHGENELAQTIAAKIIDRLWQSRDQKLADRQLYLRYHDVVAAKLILESLER
ncbi:hypothetical protein AB1K70_09175 [Bremerella sp. JC770]|uniref:hypothetical protein n=1 Tax=Bremerella sp. JC770 TaxID=3232137 RepID=UPI003457C670